MAALFYLHYVLFIFITHIVFSSDAISNAYFLICVISWEHKSNDYYKVNQLFVMSKQ